MEVKQIIQELINSNPEQMVSLYRKFNQYRFPDVNTTLDMYAVYGDPFLMELYNMYYGKMHFLGGLFKKKAKTQAGGIDQEKKEKGKFWEKFKAGAKTAIGLFAQNKEDEAEPLPAGQAPTPSGGKKKKENILGMDQNLFWGLVVVLVIVVLAVVYKMGEKK